MLEVNVDHLLSPLSVIYVPQPLEKRQPSINDEAPSIVRDEFQ